MTALGNAALRQVALKVLAQHAGPAPGAEALAAAARRAYDDLVRVLAPLIGEVGVDALTDGALYLAQREYPWLIDAREPGRAAGAFAQVIVSLERQDVAVAIEAAGAVLATFIGSLITFIGEPLAVRLLRRAWPGAASMADTDTPREEAARGSELAELMALMREANERLIVGAVRAQTMTEAAEQANHLKDEFLATVSHELRTPLNAVLGWARLLGSKQLPATHARDAIVSIEHNASTLAHLIDDLLDVSRIVAGTLRLAPEPVDLAAVVQAALNAVQPLAVTRNVQVAFSPDLTAIETVSGDPGRLQQVIWNLLANAIKFTPAGGRVDVFVERSEQQMEVRVVDTGQGISPDLLPHVFERFRQADDAPTQRHTGLGVGLAIVRQLVDLHGGTVRAASHGVGRGATFTVRLPISAGEPRVGQAAAAGERRTATSMTSPMPPLPRLDDLRILIVDDNADGRTLTSAVLTQAGASVKAVASAREALRTLEMERPDALVSDIGLPDEDGYGLIRQIRMHEAEHGGCLPAVALTGYARAEDRARILAAGFQAHVPKPVDPVELAAVIATLVRHRRNGEF